MPKSPDKGKTAAKSGKHNGKVAEKSIPDGLRLPFSKTRLSAPRPGYRLFTAITVTPLFTGAVVGSAGLPLLHLPEFVLLVLIVTAANWSSVYLCGEQDDFGSKGPWFGNRWLAVSGLVQLGLIALFYQFTAISFSGIGNSQPAVFALLAGAALALSWPIYRLVHRGEDLLFDLALTIFAMTAVAVVAVYSQSGRLVPATAILGLVPGVILAAAKTAEQARVLEAEGWKRQFTIEKKGKPVLRPGGLTRLFSSLLVVVPGLVVIVVPPGILPPSFLTLIAVMMFAPKIAQAFFEQTVADHATAERCMKLALGAGLIVGVAGWIAAAS